jgi:hypothetical protein
MISGSLVGHESRDTTRQPRHRVTLVAVAAAIAATGVTATALGQLPSFSLSWQAPAECPDEAYVRGEVEQLLAGGMPPLAHVHARARIERADEKEWRVRLTTTRNDITGERVVESASCRSLADATALIVALTVDPHIQPSHALRSPGDSAILAVPTMTIPAASAPALAGETPVRDAPATPAQTPSRVRILAQLSTSVADTLPRKTYGFSLGAALMLGKFRLEGYGLRWSAQPAETFAAPSLAASVDVTAGGLRGCFVPWDGWLQVAGCSGFELGVLHAQSMAGMPRVPLPPPGPGAPRVVIRADGPSTVGTDTTWVAATASARVLWRIAPSFGMVLDMGVVVPLHRDPLVLDKAAVKNLVAPLEGRVAVGPEIRF